VNTLTIQAVYTGDDVPTEQQLQQWVDLALQDIGRDTEIVIRIVDAKESQALNHQYRYKNKPTNILSFPADLPPEIEEDWLGDLVICAPVLTQEANLQHKALFDHWAHIVIHGILHLLGYDHINDDEAEVMETKEIALLASLHIANPYLEANHP
jgi:probable rRNA maturation factor